MKALKLVLIATILSVAMLGYSTNDPRNAKKERIIKITLTQAMSDRGLVGAMYDVSSGKVTFADRLLHGQ